MEASRLLKNQNIANRHIDDYANGHRLKLHENWRKVRRISPEEETLIPWFIENGWKIQLKFVPGVPGKNSPRTYWLDFAEPETKRYVEIDGSAHRHKDRIERDKRKDTIMQAHGWKVLRIPAEQVQKDLPSVISEIVKFN